MSPESIVSYRFRFGHSLVKRSIDRCNKEFRQVPFNVELHKEMNNPSNLHNFGSVDRILLGLSSQKLSRRDEFITDELTNHLFQVGYWNVWNETFDIWDAKDSGLIKVYLFNWI